MRFRIGQPGSIPTALVTFAQIIRLSSILAAVPFIVNSIREIHLVAFDVPYPANYGGVIDVFYKIKALHLAGIGIHLHCFSYGRNPASELDRLCMSVSYYERSKPVNSALGLLPYIVSSRKNSKLLARLSEKKIPILFEGLHTCGFIGHPSIENQHKVVRMHNIEWQYYRQLARSTQNWFEKFYFLIESWRLQNFETKLKHAQCLLGISQEDLRYLQKKGLPTEYIAPFHQNEKPNVKTGSGTFVLYHGNLSVSENILAATWILKHIKKEFHLVIAGKNPPKNLETSIKNRPNTTLYADPDALTLNSLIADAQVNLLPAFQKSGVKLKLINSLYGGRWVLANSAMLFGTNLRNLVSVFGTADEMNGQLSQLMQRPFTEADLAKRSAFFFESGNENNCNLLIKSLFPQNS